MAREKEKGGSDPLDNYVWGINAVHEALLQQNQGISEVLVQKGKAGPRIQQIIDLARQKRIKLKFADGSKLGVPGNVLHQGVVARLTAMPLQTFEQLLQTIEGEAEGPSSFRLLVLDSIQDPRNLGSILRSALAAGFEHILITRERSAPLTGTVAKTSAGALSHLNIYQVVNLSDGLQQLQKKGFWVYGAVVDGENIESVYDTDFSDNVCLVVGNEEKGIRPLVRKQCDHLITIPMSGTFNSLNVSVAAAVIMFEMRRPTLMGKG